jgi:O-antigen/teichoic acid export membrane protein
LGAERSCAFGSLLALSLAIGLFFILIPPFGLFGAATAMSITYAALGGILAYLTYKKLGIWTPALGTK